MDKDLLLARKAYCAKLFRRAEAFRDSGQDLSYCTVLTELAELVSGYEEDHNDLTLLIDNDEHDECPKS